MKVACTSPVIVRPARREDAALIVAYNAAMALETEGISLDTARLRRGVDAVLADPAKGFYRMAVEQSPRPPLDTPPNPSAHEIIMGQLMVTFEWSDWRNGMWWWVQSVYVSPQYRRRGALRTLLTETRREAEAAGALGLRLYVYHDNHVAQAAYAALGWHDQRYGVWGTENAD